MPIALLLLLVQWRDAVDVQRCRFACAWRFWEYANTSSSYIGTYGIETLLHEMLLQSPHR
jgi:hypothetical protein